MSVLQKNAPSDFRAAEDRAVEDRADEDRRPRFGIGHVVVTASDIDTITKFYTAIGFRLVMNMGRASIVELRGGTHLIFRSGEPGVASLDFIVGDIDEAREVMEAHGASPSAIRRGNPHDSFVATDPEGNTLVVNSDHSMGVV